MADNVNIANWSVPIASDEMDEFLAAAGLEEAVQSLPAGSDTILGGIFGDGVDLSVGQWQRLALARFMHSQRDADLLLLDEPSAALDAEGERELFRHIRRIANARPTIIVTHRDSSLSLCDRVIFLREGCFARSGTHSALIESDAHYGLLYSGEVLVGGRGGDG